MNRSYDTNDGMIDAGSLKTSEAIASKGKVIDGFSTSLILDKEAEVYFSSKTPVDTRTARSAFVRSDIAPEKVFVTYENYLLANGYQITSKEISAANSFIYAKKGTASLNILFNHTWDHKTTIQLTEVK